MSFFCHNYPTLLYKSILRIDHIDWIIFHPIILAYCQFFNTTNNVQVQYFDIWLNFVSTYFKLSIYLPSVSPSILWEILMRIKYLKLPYKSILSTYIILSTIQFLSILFTNPSFGILSILFHKTNNALYFDSNYEHYFHCPSTHHSVRKLNEHSILALSYKSFLRNHRID